MEHWGTADRMLGFPDVPSHQEDLPAPGKTQKRLAQFAQLLDSNAGAGVDIDAELDALQADLESIYEGR